MAEFLGTGLPSPFLVQPGDMRACGGVSVLRARTHTHARTHARTRRPLAAGAQGLRLASGIRFRAHPFCIFPCARHPGLCLLPLGNSAFDTRTW